MKETKNIIIFPFQIQALAKRDFGTTLTVKELEGVVGIFNGVDYAKLDDGGLEGIPALMAQVICHAIDYTLRDYRHSRKEK